MSGGLFAAVRRYWHVSGPLNGDPQPLLTIQQVAERLALSHWSVRELVRLGRLPAIQFVRGGHLRFRPEDVDALCTPNVGAAA